MFIELDGGRGWSILQLAVMEQWTSLSTAAASLQLPAGEEPAGGNSNAVAVVGPVLTARGKFGQISSQAIDQEIPLFSENQLKIYRARQQASDSNARLRRDRQKGSARMMELAKLPARDWQRGHDLLWGARDPTMHVLCIL